MKVFQKWVIDCSLGATGQRKVPKTVGSGLATARRRVAARTLVLELVRTLGLLTDTQP